MTSAEATLAVLRGFRAVVNALLLELPPGYEVLARMALLPSVPQVLGELEDWLKDLVEEGY